jgi:L-asparaginase
MKKKKILLILTGGTFGMKEAKASQVLGPGDLDGDRILEAVPEVKELAQIEWLSVFNLDSSDISPSHWENLANTIKNNYLKYDGFVVIHGTDTMSYSATALSFIMGTTEKPVIFTGSQRPLFKIRSDARENFINAVEFSTLDIPEVAVSFGSELFRANRSKKTSIDNYRAFRSYNFPPIARVGVGLELRTSLFRKKKEPKWRFGFDSNILFLKIFPGLNAEFLRPVLTGGERANIKGLILQGFGSGNLPGFDKIWASLIRDLSKKNIPVIITSQCNQGAVDLQAYENGRLALESGAIACGDITSDACVVKLMFGLKQSKNYKDLISFMQNDYCGELS